MAIKAGLDLKSIEQTKQQFNKLIADLKKISSNNVIDIRVRQANNDLSSMNRNVNGISNSVREQNTHFKTLRSSVKDIGSFFLKWYGTTQLLMLAMRSLKDGIQEIGRLDKSFTNIAMITDDSVDNVREMGKGWLENAKALGALNSEYVNAQEVWLRSGASIEESNKNVETNIKLARISNQSNADTADTLVTLANAYNLNSDGVENLSNKIALLDTKSATSSAKISSAMSYTAQTAKEMGISQDFLLGTLTTNLERSAQGGEAIGRAWKSIFLNMQKLQEGEDIEGLSKLEDALGQQGIALRTNEKTWRNQELVLKDIMKQYNNWDDITKSNITNLMAGKNQAEQFKTSVGESARVLELENKVKQDSNSLNESYAKTLDSIEAKTNNLKNAGTEFWTSFISGSAIKTGITGLTETIKLLQFLTVENKALGISLVAIGLAAKNFVSLKYAIGECTAFMSLLKTEGLETLTLLNFNPMVLVFSALVGIIGSVVYAQYKHSKQVKEVKAEYDLLNKSMNELDSKGIEEATNKLREQQKQLQKLNEIAREEEENGSGIKTGHQAKHNLEDYIKLLEDAGFHVNEFQWQIKELQTAEKNLLVEDNIKAIKSKTEATIEEANGTQNLIGQYENLARQENLSAEKKKMLSNITKELSGKIDGLSVVYDSNGNASISNSNLLTKQIDVIDLLKQTAVTSANAQMSKERELSQVLVDGTSIAVGEMRKRVQAYTAMIQMYAVDANNSSGSGGVYVNTKVQQAIVQADKYKSVLAGIDSQIRKIGTIPVTGSSSSGGGYTPPKNSSGSGGSSSKGSGSSSSKPQTYDFNGKSEDKFQQALALINSTLDKTDSKMSIINQEISNLEALDNPKNLNKILEKKNELLEMQKQKTRDIIKAEKDNLAVQNDIRSSIKSNFSALNGVNYTNFSKEQFEKYNPYKNLNLSGLSEAKKNALEKGQELWESLVNGWTSAQSQKLTIKDDFLKNQGDINALIKSMNDAIKERINDLLEKEKSNKLAGYDKELEAFTKLHQKKIDAIDKEIEKLDKVNDKEQEKEERLKRQNDLLQIQKELTNVKNEKNVRILTKDKNGNDVWKWVADQVKIDELTKQIKEKKEDNAKWEKDIEDKHYREKLEAQKKNEQDLITAREKYYADLKDKEEKHYYDMDKLTNNYMATLKKTYGNNWNDILLILDTKLNSAKKKNEELLGLTKPQKGKSITVNSEIDKAMLLKNHPDLDVTVDPKNKKNASGKDRYETLYLNEKKLGLNKVIKVNTAVDKAMLLAKYPFLTVIVEPNKSNASGKDRYETLKLNEKLLGFAKGGMTLDWNDGSNTNGKLVELHPNEIVNNPIDSKLLLKTMEISERLMMNLVPKINIPTFPSNCNNNSAPKSNITNYNIDVREVVTNNVDDFVRQLDTYGAVH
jgi:TP901 family phage tail tape measure protein